MARTCLALLLMMVPRTAPAESDFWAEVRRPGIGAYRQSIAEGRVLFEQRRLRESLDAFDRAARALADDPEGHLWRGNVLNELGRWREAIDAWERARELEPSLLDDRDHTFQMAITFSRVLDFPRAVAEYERLIPRLEAADGDELRAVVFANCAESLMAQGPDHLGAAVRYYRRSLEHTPDYKLAHWGLAVALDRQGSDVEARAEARRALEGDEQMMALVTGGVFFVPDYEIHWYRALGFEALGQREPALGEWRSYLAMGGATGPWADRLRQLDAASTQPNQAVTRSRGASRHPSGAPRARAEDEPRERPRETGP
ncbi:MAG: tetratricopeptide repeat protein [Deltaproteobacteria bacterium]|nr:tetratricopeptide repeat protein [Deltaproteobacteria bacterium]